MPPIDQDCELNRIRAAKIFKRVHRRAAGAAGEEHIIHNDHRSALEWKRQLRWPNDGKLLSSSQIVAMHRNIDHSGRDCLAPDRFNFEPDAARKLDSARRDSNQDKRGKIAVSLDDFVSDSA
jgi:hypothetical protein